MRNYDSRDIGPRYNCVKGLLVILVTCNVVYICSRVFTATSYTETSGTGNKNATTTTKQPSRDTDSTPSGGLVHDNGNHDDPLAIYAARKRHLQAVCGNYSGIGRPVEYLEATPRLITVDQDHPVLYCPMQKVASSLWVRLLTVIGSKGRYSNPFEITLQQKTLVPFRLLHKSLNQSQTDVFINNLFSFIFVRDPYSRLLSAYVDKIYYPNTIFWPKLINEIIDEVRVNKTHMNFLSHVTFAEFVKYIIKMHSEGRELDKHFAPLHTLCDPCAVEYSFVGKLETFMQDTDYLLDLWRNSFTDFNVSFTDFPREAFVDDTVRHVSMLFAVKHLLSNLSDEDLYSVINRGWSNLILRGYIDRDRTMPFTPYEIRNLTMDSFMDLVVNITTAAPLAKERAKQQRDESLVQAYRSVSEEDLESLRQFVLEDCRLFGYDDRPAVIFNRDPPDSSYSYFPTHETW